MAFTLDRALRAAAAAMCMLSGAVSARAQTAPPDTTKCDSIVFAASVDSIKAGLFIVADRADNPISGEQADAIASAIGSMFVAPTPFRLSVFAGPAQMRTFRRVNTEATERRSPTVTGVYRFWSTRDAKAPLRIVTARASLVPGFDSAVTRAIVSAAEIRTFFTPPPGDDSMLVEVRFSSDSVRNSKRIVNASFPVMLVKDAVPRADNIPPAFPESEKTDSSRRGEVVLRLVVDRNGDPVGETVEVVRATSIPFLRSALTVLPEQRFTPAQIRGCSVAQVMVYPFAFVMPDSVKAPPRH